MSPLRNYIRPFMESCQKKTPYPFTKNIPQIEEPFRPSLNLPPTSYIMQSSKFDNDTWKHGAIEKPDGSNYGDCKRSISSAPRVVGAFGIVTGDDQPPAGNAGAAAKLERYRKCRALAAHLHVYSCMPNIHIRIYVHDLKDPKEIWETLVKWLDFSASQTGRAAILTKFLNARPDSGEKIGLHVARLQSYQSKLHGTDEAITGGLLRNRTYGTAPSQFRNLISNLKDHQTWPPKRPSLGLSS